jgi:hypothetical protein
MKKLLILFLLLLSLAASAQKRNVVYLCLQPNNLGYGLRYDYHFNEIGLYSSLTYGSYTFFGGFIKEHIKASAGMTFLNKRKPFADDYNFLSVGTSYNIYKGVEYDKSFNKAVFHPLALEIGAGTIIGWFSLAFRYELVKSNVSLDVGIKF